MNKWHRDYIEMEIRNYERSYDCDENSAMSYQMMESIMGYTNQWSRSFLQRDNLIESCILIEGFRVTSHKWINDHVTIYI